MSIATLDLETLITVTGGHHSGHPAAETSAEPSQDMKDVTTCRQLDKAVNLLKTSNPDVSSAIRPIADQCWTSLRSVQ